METLGTEAMPDLQTHRSETGPDADWTPDAAEALYGLPDWGQGYFGVDPRGHVRVRPGGGHPHSIDLHELVVDLRRRDVATPLLLRFSGILEDRLRRIAESFGNAIREFDYRGSYRGVYPIKVNQQKHVVEELLNYGKEYGFGLEAGSKPELLATMALVDDPETLIICNGFKDRQFVEAVVLSRKLGRNVIPVVEKFSELRLIIEQSKAHGVRPAIGVRVKLASAGSGRWQGSGGERSKFGLFVSEVLEAVELLREEGMLDCLKLVHFHLGSQINDMRALKSALVEAARMYAELAKLGAGLGYLDVGGGLGVDYDGTKSGHDSSTNYTLAEYANNVVYHIGEVCRGANVPAPTIITESGRAMVAHHSVLVVDVLGWSGLGRFEAPAPLDEPALLALPAPVRTLYETLEALDVQHLREYFHDAQVAREQALSLFSLGYCSLEHRGLAEQLFYAICTRVHRIARTLDPVPDEFAELETLLSDTYFCNASIFQSLPDSWAIDQLFPVVPIHRLDERPTCRGVLADITCDSDGKIDRFVAPPGSGRASVPVLPLHPYTGEDYLLGIFLVGAYQETLGDLHNLFGDTNAVHVHLDTDGHVHIDEVVAGDTVADVLRYVQFEPEHLQRKLRKTLEAATRAQRLTVEEAGVLRRFYDQGLSGYTYLS
ncbi:MAG: biosynthetic arginine decarboxylase [Planctomycetota bacterium]